METRTEQSQTDRDSQVLCASCGRAAQEPPLGWSRQASARADGVPDWLCESCTREHLWAIEGKLDNLW